MFSIGRALSSDILSTPASLEQSTFLYMPRGSGNINKVLQPVPNSLEVLQLTDRQKMVRFIGPTQIQRWHLHKQ